MAPFLPKDEYQNIPCVVYYRLEPKQKAKRVNYVCFGSMRDWGVPSAIRYIAPINNTCYDGTKVADGAMDFYLRFIKSILRRPESPKFLIKKLKNTVHFRLESRGLNYFRALFFLTWFRYVHHYPEVIHHLYIGREKDETLEYTFRRFFAIHNDYINGKLKVSSKAAANEMVMYNWGGAVEPISLERLWSNMEKGAKKQLGVQEYLK